MINKISWEEFQETGLLLFINHILNAFGIAIVVSKENNEIIEVFPARVNFRGFSEKSQGDSYEKITNYLKENINDLVEETKGD